MAIATSTAIIGAAVVGAVAAKSASDSASKSAEKARQSQERAVEAQKSTADKQLEFQQAQYQDWQNTYGPIQDNLSEYYQNLTPAAFIASGLQDLEQQYRATQEQLDRSFAQRGIDSRAQDLLQQEVSLSAAESRASIRTLAPQQVATAQQGFLNQQVTNPATTGVSNAMGNQANVLGNQANAYGDQAARAEQQQGQAVNQLGQSIQTGVSMYTNYQQQQQIQNQQYANNLAGQAGSYYSSGNAPLINNTPPSQGGWEML